LETLLILILGPLFDWVSVGQAKSWPSSCACFLPRKRPSLQKRQTNGKRAQLC
jgi:hypothetical protein